MSLLFIFTLLRLLPCSDNTLRPLHFIDYSENTLKVIPIPNPGFNTLFFALAKPIIIGEILIQGHGTYGSGVVGFRFDNLIHWYVIFVF